MKRNIKKIWKFIKTVLTLSEVSAPKKRTTNDKQTQNKKKKLTSEFVVPQEILLRGKPAAKEKLPLFTSEKAYGDWLADQLRSYAEPLIQKYAAQLWFTNIPLKIRVCKGRRGSCSSKKSIMLNRHLVHAEKASIEAVIVHEVAHLREMNHKKAFWDLVYMLYPDYDRQHKKLQKLAPLILNTK